MAAIIVDTKNKEKFVLPKDMREGQVGVIVKWGLSTNYVGTPVMKIYHGVLVNLVGGGDWNEEQVLNFNDINKYSIRLLRDGECVQISND